MVFARQFLTADPKMLFWILWTRLLSMPGRFSECLFWQRPGEGNFCLQTMVVLFQSFSYTNVDSNQMHVVRHQAETSTRNSELLCI